MSGLYIAVSMALAISDAHVTDKTGGDKIKVKLGGDRILTQRIFA